MQKPNPQTTHNATPERLIRSWLCDHLWMAASDNEHVRTEFVEDLMWEIKDAYEKS